MLQDQVSVQPRLIVLKEKKVVGMCREMSFVKNTTAALWRQFMPRRGEIRTVIGTELYSIEKYGRPDFFSAFDPEALFEKWAAVEVADNTIVPEGMKSLIIPEGLYAVFLYRGLASEGEAMYRHIFGVWLPESGYVPDNRPHLAVMGEQYRHEDPSSEEDLWIPVKPK